MTQLLLHEATRKQLTAHIQHPPHAIGIIGAKGAGKTALALELSKELLGRESLENYAYFKQFSPDGGSVTIEQAREIIGFTKLKTTGTNTIRRIVVIEDADTMSREAQNAVLKVIEEPPEDTVIILTLYSKQAVLPTIISRLQLLTVAAPTVDQATEYFSAKDFTTSNIQRTYTISGGNIGLMYALLQQDTQHPLVQHIEKAKDILKADTFERLVMVDDIVKGKETADILYALQQTAQSALVMSAKAGNAKAVDRWQYILQNTNEAREFLRGNTQVKLVLTNLLIRL